MCPDIVISPFDKSNKRNNRLVDVSSWTRWTTYTDVSSLFYLYVTFDLCILNFSMMFNVVCTINDLWYNWRSNAFCKHASSDDLWDSAGTIKKKGNFQWCYFHAQEIIMIELWMLNFEYLSHAPHELFCYICSFLLTGLWGTLHMVS